MTADALDIIDDTLRVIVDRQPVDELPLTRAVPGAGVVPAFLVDSGRIQAAREQPAYHFVGEGFHTAVGVMNHEPFASTEQLVGNDERANSVVACPSARVPDDMR